MTDATARLALPTIAPGQAQKELIHNEALTLLDAAVQASVVAADLNTPPASPAEGQCWIIGTAPTGGWTGHARHIAAWTAGGWRFIAPYEGMTTWIEGTGGIARYVAGTWRSYAPVARITPPSGGTTVDSQSRTAIAAIIAALEHHGLALTA